MNISQLLELQKKKAQLEAKKKQMLKKQLHKKKLQQINLDNSGVKKGYIEKTKTIEKKKYETIRQKARTIPVEIQQNATVCSYLINNQNYKKIYQRTKKIIDFNKNSERLSQSIAALKAFGIQNNQKIIHLKLIFENQINCGQVIRPFKLDLPYKNLIPLNKKFPIPKAILLVKNVKSVQKSQTFKNLIHDSIEIKQYSQFLKDFKNKTDKKFKKNISQNRILILCEWQIYKEQTNRFIGSLLQQNYVIFPFDIKKVPFFFLNKNPGMTYEQYLKQMIENQYALIKSGNQHTVHIKLIKDKNTDQTQQNIKEAIIQVVAKHIQRNKDKGNCLLKAQIKTNTSLNFVIYQK